MNASEGKKFAWIQTIRFSKYSSNFWNSTPSTLNFLIDKIAVVIKGPIIIYVERGGGGGGKICRKDQDFCKAPLADHVNSKWPPFFIQNLHDYVPTSYLLLYALQSIIKMHVIIRCYELRLNW